MVLSRPLLVAAIAGALLVVSIGVDAAMNRTYALDAQENGGWRQIATSSRTDMEKARPYPADFVHSASNGTVTLRLRVDNGYLWPSSDDWDARVNDISYAHGTLSAPSRGTAEVTFSIPANAWKAGSGSPMEPKTTGSSGNITYGYISVQVGKEYLSASIQLQEASS